MPDKKSNHFVPQFYLRNFGEGNSVPLFNIKQQRFVPSASIPSQCQRDYLYGKNSAVEDALGALEGEIAKIVRAALDGKGLPQKGTSDYVSLITFICFQMSRSPLAGENMLETMTKMMRTVFRNDPSLPQHLKGHIDDVEMTHENPVLFTMALLGQHAIALDDLHPILIENESGVGFITSDAPVVMFNQWAQDVLDRGVLGMACSGLQIFFPLSPKCLLMLYDDEIYTVHKRARLNTAFSVHGINALQLTSAINNIYFDGSASTQEAIRKLPFHWRTHATNATEVVEAPSVSNPDNESLIHTFKRLVGQLKIPEISIRTVARDVPVRNRGGRHRAKSREILSMHDKLLGAINPSAPRLFRSGKLRRKPLI